MAQRFFGEFADDQGDEWRINIYDDAYTGSTTEVTLGAEGFVLSYDGNQDDMFQRVITSKVTFSAYQRSSTAFEDWIDTDIVQRNESEVKVAIFKDPDGDNTLYWAGVMMVDQVTIPDDFDGFIQITASDGLALLTRDSFGTQFPVQEEIIVKLAKVVARVATADFWSTSEGFLRYVNDYEPNTYTGTDFLMDGEVKEPLNNNDLTFNGDPKPFNTYKKVEGILSAFNMRLFQAEGYWWALPLTYYERISESGVPSSLFRQVDKEGTTVTLTFNESSYLNANKIYEDGVTGNRLAGGNTLHLVGKKRVEIKRLSANLNFLHKTLIGQGPYDNTAPQTSTSNGILYSEGTSLQIQGSTLFFRYPDDDIAGDAALVTMKLNTFLQVGDLYYNGTSWQSGSTSFFTDIQSFLRDSGTVHFVEEFFIETSPLPSDEDGAVLTASIVFIDGVDDNVSDEMTNSNFSFTLFFQIADASANQDFAYLAESSEENYEDVVLADTIIGSLHPFGSLLNSNGSITYDDDVPEFYQGYTWDGVPSGGAPLLTRVTNDALRMAQLPTKVKSNSYYYAVPQMWHTFKQGTEYYVPLTLTINMNARITDVNRFLIDYDGDNITDDSGGTGGDSTVPIGGLTDSGGAVDSVNGQTGPVVLDGDDIAYDGSFTVNDLIDANTSNIDNLKSYVVSATDKVDLREDANNKVTVDGTSTLEAITLTVDGTDVFKVNDSEVISTVATEAPTLEANTFAGGLILTDSTGTRWRVQVQTDGTLRTTSL